MPRMQRVVAALALLGSASAAGGSTPSLVPVRLAPGVNEIANIAGTGQNGKITLLWRENGNAWSYDLFIVEAGGSIATINGENTITDTPHVGEDMIRSVRFARGTFRGRTTLQVLTATRTIVTSTYQPAKTKIEQFALVENDTGTGTPFEFVRVRSFVAQRLYCNAEMALKTEIGLSLTRSYSGAQSATGC